MTDENCKKAEALTDCLVISDNKLKDLMKLLDKEFNNGLKDEQTSTVKMLITYVRNLPNSQENGKYLALDLGGTNFRVILVNFKGTKVEMESEEFIIPKELMVSDGKYLFDFIADSIITFTSNQGLERTRIGLGFTFSFPCIQHSISQARLLRWTKGFNCPNVVNHNIVKLLKDSLKYKSRVSNAFVDIVAVINDTTGTLMSCAHTNSQCGIGLIVGTGFNSCYVEKLDNIEKWNSNYTLPKQVVINTEWGAFGDNNIIEFIRTDWDRTLDNQSINRGNQCYEKMVSGMYLGELVRLVLISLIKEKLLFQGFIPPNLQNRNSFITKYVSQIDLDLERDDFCHTKRVFAKHFDKTDCTETDLKIIFMVNNRVSKRAAHLVSAGCATLLNRMKRQNNTIAYDGSVIRLHPHFRKWVEEKISQLIDSEINYTLMVSEDGSGRGAAIVAAVCYREKRPKFIKSNGKIHVISNFNR